MKTEQRKIILESLFGFFLARIMVFGITPFGLGYFGAAFSVGKGRLCTGIAVFLGMLTVAEPVDCLKMFVLLASLFVVKKLLKEYTVQFGIHSCAWFLAMASVGISITKILIYPAKDYSLWLLPVEFILVLCSTRIFYEGVRYMTLAKKGQPLENTELLSLVLLLTGTVYGMPDTTVGGMEFLKIVTYIFLIVLSYIHGVGAGAVAGCSFGILMGIVGGDGESIGLMCLLGIAPGIFREYSRFASALAFVATNIFLGIFFSTDILGIEYYREILAAIGIFLALPSHFITKAGVGESVQTDTVFTESPLGELITAKMQDFSNAFEQLAKTLAKTNDSKKELGRVDMLDIFDDLSDRLCEGCQNRHLCWKEHYYDTYRSAFSLLDVANQQGIVLKEDVSTEFASRCIRFEEFVREVNASLALARNAISWQNRFAQNRLAVAGQMGEVSVIIQEFAKELQETKVCGEGQKEDLFAALQKQGIKVRDISILEKHHKRKEIYITAKGGKRSCVTTRCIAGEISRILGKRMKADEGMRSVVGKEFEVLHFIEDTTYTVTTGMAKLPKQDEVISADHFSLLQLASGRMLMILSDGMGSGEEACVESQAVIELLEQLTEAGFSAKTALQLVNSVMMIGAKETEKQTFTSVDVSELDLYTGKCRFVKSGAPATYIRSRGRVEVIDGESLPVGILPDSISDSSSRRIHDGDYIIMATDGVIDSLTAYGIHSMEEVILENGAQNPKELADYILQMALQEAGCAMDDMTVLVALVRKR